MRVNRNFTQPVKKIINDSHFSLLGDKKIKNYWVLCCFVEGTLAFINGAVIVITGMLCSETEHLGTVKYRMAPVTYSLLVPGANIQSREGDQTYPPSKLHH
jgi:hypothetical protein